MPPPSSTIMPPTPQEKKPVGPIVGTVIIVILLAFGALYFWGAHLDQQKNRQPLPLIPGDAAVE